MFKKLLRFIFKLLVWFVIISLGLVLLYKWVPVPVTPLMVIRSIQQKQSDKAIVWKHEWIALDKISKNLQLAVICSEDQKFVYHNGFDVQAIEKVINKASDGGKLRGASTISQQTAKNVFLWPGRSWIRKGFEVYFTFLIEQLWGKEHILEVYLNSIEMGNGIYGAEAASQYWFHKKAGGLSKYEAAAIAAILPNPLKMKAAPASNYIQQRKEWIVTQMGYYGAFSLPK
ncbi:monofunctional biosynthetic peptidoglycan transglycosylase [Galbibacter pacificus]|uniref:Biosynthetic peptidoglycan transglycosylase n=1 Tax=Galbibacter pacificus TaxID=2996052 RepID=A0ABT6FSJ0_9FLAO|nr:monofunctional biosynthetic peptidoglycan transglycosylase [Galbibacter pacificus]MDG3582810.1 monofunctional biosynthetic peptidoglycan transglycosylase [Galbibacter pacificus]MDG3586071.1 monofunctional biosynthetic peptidoglycan transglycosylase [Galbibacter pacificus]